MCPTVCLALVLLSPQAVGPPGSAQPAGLLNDERLLERAGVATSGPGLLAYLRGRIPTEAQRLRLEGFIRDLGDDTFATRELATAGLIEAGPTALPLLRPATKHLDLEVRRRASRCVERIEAEPHAERLEAVLRLIGQRRPAGADLALLEYVAAAGPASWGSDGTSEGALAALALAGVSDGKPTEPVLRALGHALPAPRQAAAHAVAGAAPRERAVLVPLLRDPSAAVRYEAARGLITAADRRAVPTLVALVGEASEVGSRAEELLLAVAGETPPPVGWSPDPATRVAAVKGWGAWWDAKGATLDLAKVSFSGPSLGLIVTAEFPNGAGLGLIRVLGLDRKERWRVEVDSPTDVQLLPGSRVLVAEHNPNRIVERDRSGKVLWEKKLTDKPTVCQRLPGGNTFIATYNSILEVTPAGTELYKIPGGGGMIYGARKLRDGGIVCINSTGLVRHFDRDRKEIRKFTPAAHANGCSWWAGVDVLPGDRYLLALGTSDRVVETDGTGKILWEATVTGGLSQAMRLPSGNTLIAALGANCIVEVDRAGKEVWREKTPGRPFRALRY